MRTASSSSRPPASDCTARASTASSRSSRSACAVSQARKPGSGDSVEKRRGRFPKKRRPKKTVKRFGTPLDGDLKLSLSGPDRADLALKLFDSAGHLLARSDGVGSKESVSYQICGQRGVSAVVRRHGRRLTRFTLTALIP